MYKNLINRKIIGHLFKIAGDDGDDSEKMSVAEVSAFLDALLEEIPGGFFIYRADEDERILYENKAMLRIMGCETHEEFIKVCGGTFKGLVHPDDIDDVERAIAEQIEESQYDLDYVEYRVIRRDGQIRWIEDYGHFVHDEKLGGFFYVFVNDATDKLVGIKKEREELIAQSAESKSKYLSLMEEYDNERKVINKKYLRRLEVIKGLSENYASILYVDLENDMTVGYRLSERTKAFFRDELDERTYSSFVAEYIDMWVHPDDKEKMEQAFAPQGLKKRLSERKYYIENYRCICNGEIQHLQVQIARVYDGTSDAVVGFRKVDEEIENQMKQKQILEEALKGARLAAESKDVFLSNMSHDMRTPLNAVFGYVKLLRQQTAGNDLAFDYLSKIESAAGHVLEMTEKVLMLSASGEGDVIEEGECNIADLVHTVFASLRQKANLKGVSLTLEGNPDTMVYADGQKIARIIHQLGDNAIKYTEKGGTVTIIAEADVGINGYAECKFTVTDTGVGISKEFMPKLFEPFEREHNTTKSGSFGSGLGLTLVKSFIDRMGGRIEVESEPGKGSTFTVTFTLRCSEKQNDTFDMDKELDEIRAKKILIVEDNMLNLEIEEMLLEDRGFSVECAENGKIAIEKLCKTPEDYYALVLMDIQMPVMDGWEATAEIRKMKHRLISNIPIIAVSANALETDVARSAKAGMDAHIAKPIDIDHLLETMSAIYHKRKGGKKVN